MRGGGRAATDGEGLSDVRDGRGGPHGPPRAGEAALPPLGVLWRGAGCCTARGHPIPSPGCAWGAAPHRASLPGGSHCPPLPVPAVAGEPHGTGRWGGSPTSASAPPSLPSRSRWPHGQPGQAQTPWERRNSLFLPRGGWRARPRGLAAQGQGCHRRRGRAVTRDKGQMPPPLRAGPQRRSAGPRAQNRAGAARSEQQLPPRRFATNLGATEPVLRAGRAPRGANQTSSNPQLRAKTSPALRRGFLEAERRDPSRDVVPKSQKLCRSGAASPAPVAPGPTEPACP